MRRGIHPLGSHVRFSLAILTGVLFIASAGTVIHYSAGTRIVRSGRYGPFQIGEDRQSALGKVEQLGIKHVEPLPYETIFIRNPSEQQFARLNPYDGVLVWSTPNHGFPLRVEFSNGKVSKTWPEMKVEGHEPLDWQDGIRTLSQLQSRLVLGLPRSEAAKFILESGQVHPIEVGNFVVGEQEWRMSFDGAMTDPARELLLRSEAWKFEGLRDEIWYNAYYSQVKLFFKNGKLERIEHFVFPFEMP